VRVVIRIEFLQDFWLKKMGQAENGVKNGAGHSDIEKIHSLILKISSWNTQREYP